VSVPWTTAFSSPCQKELEQYEGLLSAFMGYSCNRSTINRALKSSLGSSASLTFVHEVREVFLLLNGIVKSFDESKGYGWIVPNDGTNDLIVRQRNIVGDNIRTLPTDARVTYDSRTNDKGLEAINVSLMK
jgi:CspA family cold shock protein